MANFKLRLYARGKNVYLYEIANKMNISEPTLTRKLRIELSKDEKSKIMAIIDEISKEKEMRG